MNFEEIFVKRFVLKNKQDRLLFELLSGNKTKRAKAFAKLTTFNEIINSDYIISDVSYLTDEDALKEVKKYIKEKEGYILSTKDAKSVEEAYKYCVNSYMADIIVISRNKSIYIGEVEYGASTKYILINETEV